MSPIEYKILQDEVEQNLCRYYFPAQQKGSQITPGYMHYKHSTESTQLIYDRVKESQMTTPQIKLSVYEEPQITRRAMVDYFSCP